MKSSGVITNDKSDVHAKGQGQRLKVKVGEVKTQFSRFRTVTPVEFTYEIILADSYDYYVEIPYFVFYKKWHKDPLDFNRLTLSWCLQMS